MGTLHEQPDGALPEGREASSAAPPVSRRAVLARGMLGAAAVSVLAACGAPRRPAPVAAPLRPTPVGTPVRRSETELDALRDGARRMVLAGSPLDVGLLRRFYARRDFEPVWTDRKTEADALVAAILQAGDHGLDPEAFYAGLLRRRMGFPPGRRELLLTHAVLTYAEALAKGVVPPDRRTESEALVPDPVDVVAVLDGALGGGDPVAAIEALAPATPTYRALREALRRGAPVGRLVRTVRPGRPDRRAIAANRPRDMVAANWPRDIKVNLERQRWLPRSLPADRVWVNVPDQALVLYREDRPVFTTRVIVGGVEEPNQSPEFQTMIEASWFNPPWIVPPDIVESRFLPLIARDPGYLARNNMVMLETGEIEQRPGPTAGLGAIMFDMPNRFDVYLHDTPGRALFRRGNRRMSAGCIRVQNPIEFAALVMREPADAIRARIAQGGTVRRELPTPVPVFIVYQTAFVDAAGALQFRPDFYNRDARLWRQLQEPAQA